jgi:hypothetical protein
MKGLMICCTPVMPVARKHDTNTWNPEEKNTKGHQKHPKVSKNNEKYIRKCSIRKMW